MPATTNKWPKVLVVKGHHDTDYYVVMNWAGVFAVAHKIVKDRSDEGCWYIEKGEKRQAKAVLAAGPDNSAAWHFLNSRTHYESENLYLVGTTIWDESGERAPVPPEKRTDTTGE